MKNYEKELPNGYIAVKTVDAKSDKKTVGFLTLLSFITAVPAFIIPMALFALRAEKPVIKYSQMTIAYVSLLFGMIAYIILHEIVHGIAYKSRTGEKLTFGMTLTCAYCGVPNIYTYRKTSLIAVSAPLIVFSVLFVIAMVVTYFVAPIAYLVLAAIFTVHISGCAGDMYVIYLLTKKYKDDTVLMNDTGPKMTIYKRADGDEMTVS